MLECDPLPAKNRDKWRRAREVGEWRRRTAPSEFGSEPLQAYGGRYTRRTCVSEPPDNLLTRECYRIREYLRQLVMQSKSRPTPTGANAGRPARVSTTENVRRAPGPTCVLQLPSNLRSPDKRNIKSDVAVSLIIKMQATRHRGCHGRAYETHCYGRPPRSTDAECGRRFAPTTLRTAKRHHS
ncbi:hypothetical protein EVAR_9276_1 [Eumeta japonica]|uniref:Uncharacterized protein n=1 Tax=Eumeta variegata TaxID=151549 RepID=A0A4C1TMZ6_EUMVA|nr:hypothetical protein EVAR_9276_1 [Eumeta japonica]